MSTKTNKSLTKRLKITSKGKVLCRQPGKNHFQAKESRRKQLTHKRWEVFDIRKKTLTRYVPSRI